MPSNGKSFDFKKFTGVASVSVMAVNPNNATLRKFGWDIPADADEPKYVFEKQAEDGSYVKSARVCFLLRINDFDDKPVIPYNIWIRQNFIIGKNSGKCRIIDSFGRTAWATKEEVKTKAIPQYSNGPANISNDYKGCHPGQEQLIAFLFKYLNITPLQMFDKKQNSWVPSKNPGRLTIDNWANLMDGNANEIAEYLALQPDNRVKVILGVKTTDDNKEYQVILDDCDGTTKSPFIGNGASPDAQTGEYKIARSRIDEYFKNNPSATVSFSAKPVREYTVTASSVEESEESDYHYEPAIDNENEDLPF